MGKGVRVWIANVVSLLDIGKRMNGCFPDWNWKLIGS